MSSKRPNDSGIPDDIFAGDSGVDFANMYLSASEEEDVQDGHEIQERVARGDLAVDRHNSVQAFARRAKVAYPPTTGARVRFARTIEAVFSYENPPAPGASGTIITVRTASGDVNHFDGKVFVRWDTGVMLPVYAEHVVAGSGASRVADAVSRRVAGLGDLSDFLKVANDTLVHKATKDLWALRRDGSDLVIERLFDETGSPLKV